jgi:hypothetical protein
VIESSAILGKGIRESFVLAVRLATERASLLMERGKLPIGKPDIINGEALLAHLKDNVEVNTLTDNNLLLDATIDFIAPQPVKTTHLPQLPDENIAPQWLWPPLLGKKMLANLLKNQLKLHLKEDKTWVLNSNSGWRCFSKTNWQYTDPTEARHALRHYIELHLQCSPFLSEQRCLALTQEDEQQWRLWQILHKVPTLADKLQQALQLIDITKLVEGVMACAQHYVQAQQQAIHYTSEFNLTLDNIGVDLAQQLIYLGCLDNRSAQHLASEAELIDGLKRAFTIPIAQQKQSLDIAAICSEIENTPLENLSGYGFIPATITELFLNTVN